MDRQTVAAALDAKKVYIIYKPDLVAAKHHAALVELCRQQHEFIKTVMVGKYVDNYRQLAANGDYLLALWPDGGE